MALSRSGGWREGNRGAYAPKPQEFDSLSDAQSVPLRPGFMAWIEGPDDSYAYVAGQWSRRFSRVDVLEEVIGSEMTSDRIEQRVNDWASRIDDLYQQIESWLPQGCTAERNGSVRMHEEPMQKFGIPPRKLPILDLMSRNERVGRIEPRSLWMIGANGRRLDFFGGSDHYVITDAASSSRNRCGRSLPFPIAVTQNRLAAKPSAKFSSRRVEHARPAKNICCVLRD